MTYLAIHDPRGGSIQLTSDSSSKTMSSFTDIEPSWYSLSAQIQFSAEGQDGPATGQVTCGIGGGSEEPVGGDRDTLVLTSTTRGGQFKLQTVVPVNNEGPVAMNCSAGGLTAGDTINFYEFNFVLIKLNPQNIQHN